MVDFWLRAGTNIRYMKRFAPARGFTLIEVLVVMSIVSILLALGAPSFRESIERNAVSGHANTFMNSIRYARSEAIRSGLTVAMCRSTNPESSSPSCAAGAGDWVSGWIIFVNRDNDGTFDADDILLRVQGPITNSGGILYLGSANVVLRFRPTGLMSSGAGRVTFNAPSFNVDRERGVCVSLAGRARLLTDAFAACSNSDS